MGVLCMRSKPYGDPSMGLRWPRSERYDAQGPPWLYPQKVQSRAVTLLGERPTGQKRTQRAASLILGQPPSTLTNCLNARSQRAARRRGKCMIGKCVPFTSPSQSCEVHVLSTEGRPLASSGPNELVSVLGATGTALPQELLRHLCGYEGGLPEAIRRPLVAAGATGVPALIALVEDALADDQTDLGWDPLHAVD